MNEYKEHIINEFNKYTANYDLTDPKNKLKYEHTFRVADFCEEIANSINLSEEDVELAWTCGMLHDIGRFEQVKRYGTFIDSQSVDHAQFGADLLFKDGLYDRFVMKAENEAYRTKREIIELAIREHNVFRISDTLSEREKIFANILRDADKIDILRVNCDTPTEDVYNVTTEVLKNTEVSDDVKAAFNERRCARRTDRHSPVDHLAGHVCLTFELVYRRSLEMMFEQGYLFKLMEFKSDIDETNKWFEYMNQEMKRMQKKLKEIEK